MQNIVVMVIRHESSLLGCKYQSAMSAVHFFHTTIYPETLSWQTTIFVHTATGGLLGKQKQGWFSVIEQMSNVVDSAVRTVSRHWFVSSQKCRALKNAPVQQCVFLHIRHFSLFHDIKPHSLRMPSFHFFLLKFLLCKMSQCSAAPVHCHSSTLG